MLSPMLLATIPAPAPLPASYVIAGAYYERTDEGGVLYSVELEPVSDASDFALLDVTFDEDDRSELRFVVGDDASATAWVLSHAERVIEACLEAKHRGLDVGPWTRVWRPEVEREDAGCPSCGAAGCPECTGVRGWL